GVSVVDLVRWNQLDSAQVEPGTELTVYLPDSSTDAEGEIRPMDTSAPSPAPAAAEEEIALVPVPAGKLIHRVTDGETLSSVADKYGVGMAEITLWNGLQSAALTPGQMLTIFLEAESGAPQTDAT